MSQAYSGKIVVVTGAGRGIGRAIAEAFAAAGAKVVVGARTISYGEEAVAAIRDAGGEATLCSVDVTDRSQVEALVATTVKVYGGLDIAVHSAADIPAGGLDVTEEALDRGLASIIKAPIWLARAARPYLRKSKDGGRLIFISSVAGPRTISPGLGAYCISKGGLETFIRSTALELARENITVNGIEPGLIASARQLESMGAEGVEAVGASTPVGRAGTPEEVAHAALFLASPMSGYITGTNIIVDGGFVLSHSDLADFGVDSRQLSRD